jgi:hypothetical protein
MPLFLEETPPPLLNIGLFKLFIILFALVLC